MTAVNGICTEDKKKTDYRERREQDTEEKRNGTEGNRVKKRERNRI